MPRHHILHTLHVFVILITWRLRRDHVLAGQAHVSLPTPHFPRESSRVRGAQQKADFVGLEAVRAAIPPHLEIGMFGHGRGKANLARAHGFVQLRLDLRDVSTRVTAAREPESVHHVLSTHSQSARLAVAPELGVGDVDFPPLPDGNYASDPAGVRTDGVDADAAADEGGDGVGGAGVVDEGADGEDAVAVGEHARAGDGEDVVAEAAEEGGDAVGGDGHCAGDQMGDAF